MSSSHTAMRLLVLLLVICALCPSSFAVPVSDSDSPRQIMGFMGKRSFSDYIPWQKKWARLEPSIRFFKRSGVQRMMYEDDGYF